MKKNNNLLITLFLLGAAIVLSVLGFYLQNTTINGYSFPAGAIIIFNAIIFLIILVLLFISRKLFLMEKREKLLEIQELHFRHLRELVGATRAQRHDFINHLQVIYALLKTGQTERAERYIEEYSRDVRITGEMLRIDIPELAALLLVKIGVAVSKNISFELKVESTLNELKIKPLDLNTVIANLVDNAFEAVETLTDARVVVLRVFETARYFVFQTINPGFIGKELRNKIFEAGVSTKPGERGVGLASVKRAVEKNRGKIVVSSRPDRDTRFTVTFPK